MQLNFANEKDNFKMYKFKHPLICRFLFCLLLVSVFTFTALSAMAAQLGQYDRGYWTHSTNPFHYINIRFDNPLPGVTRQDWTMNGGLPLPNNFKFFKDDYYNQRAYDGTIWEDRVYKFRIYSPAELPETLEFRNYESIDIRDSRRGTFDDTIANNPFRGFDIVKLMPLSVLTKERRRNTKIFILFNALPYPEMRTKDFTINGGDPIPTNTWIDREDDSLPLYSFVLPETPSTLRFRDFPEVVLTPGEVTAFTLIPVVPRFAEIWVDIDEGKFNLTATIYYNGSPVGDFAHKLTDFTYNGGVPIPIFDEDDELERYTDFESEERMDTEWGLVWWNADRPPETLELKGYEPMRLFSSASVIDDIIAKYEGSDEDDTIAELWIEIKPSNSVVIRDTASDTARDTDTVLFTKPSADIPAKDKIVINEIANLSGENDWLELLNISDSPQSLDKWALSIVTEYNDETEIIRFPDISIPAGGILLLVNRDPANTALATGHNVQMNIESQAEGADERISYLIMKGETNYGFTSTGIALPNHNDWLLILRSGKPWDVKDGTNVYNTGYQIEDAAGPASITLEIDENEINLPKEKNKDGTEGGDLWHTTVFPLNGREETGEILLRYDRTLNEGTVHARNVNKHGFEVHSFDPAPFTGIGYDSDITDDGGHLGTPGYPNIVASNVSDLKTGRFIVSELMLTTNNGKNAQWIELHNTSQSEAISLEDPDGDGALTAWKMTIENHNSGSWKRIRRNLHVEVDLSEWFQYIPPRQKVLIAAFADRNSGASDFPSTRVATLWETHRRSFSMIKRGNLFLNASGGFTIKITDSQGNVSDSVGNLDGTVADPDEGIGHDDPVGFDWPTELTEDGHRTSLIRLKNTDGTPRTGMPTRDSSGDATDKKGAALPLGSDESSDTESYAWKHAADINLDDLAKITWFGSEDDISTPLNTENTMMPVLLSFFRPIMENGEVLIQWTTEAELDNAGFHILRSETRNGHFKRINTQLIQGAGSTAERQTYEWIDTTAKPGVVYYYQIEDVSFSGERYRLATTKLKGLVSAKNKLTTQWGALKK